MSSKKKYTVVYDNDGYVLLFAGDAFSKADETVIVYEELLKDFGVEVIYASSLSNQSYSDVSDIIWDDEGHPRFKSLKKLLAVLSDGEKFKVEQEIKELEERPAKLRGELDG